MKTTKIKHSLNTLPTVTRISEKKDVGEFPLDHYSYSCFVKFCTNLNMFKLNYINHEKYETKRNISGVIGNAFHRSMEVYYSKINSNESDAIKLGMESGLKYLEKYNDCFIQYSEKKCPNKQKACEKFVKLFQFYIKESDINKEIEILETEGVIEEHVSVEWKGELIEFPVRFKGYLDKIIREDGKIKIVDYKTTDKFSDLEKIDGGKMIQSIVYFFLVYAKYGEKPYSIIFEEVKGAANKDGSNQVRKYEIVYENNPLFFDFFFRLYDDMTRHINGESVYPPNIHAFYDNEISIISYIHHLDIPEERARQMKKFKAKNITELLKQNIVSAGNMKKLLQTAEKKFISAKTLNYESMKTEEKICAKLMQFTITLEFDSKIEGCSVDLYRFIPSIGIKMSKLLSYSADIEQVIGVQHVRILAPIPNTSFIGIEIPREKRTFPGELPKTDGFNLAIGVDILGETKRFDIRKSPHMLIAGATGSGKSVFLNTLLKQLCSLNNVELHLFDPKRVELSQFKNEKNTVEHYYEPEDVFLALSELEQVMNKRYDLLSKEGVRNIEEYNQKNNMTYKFIVIDEFGDLTASKHIMTEEIKTGEYYERGPKKGMEKIEIKTTNLSAEIMKYILLLAQKARACGIHIIIATQRPSVDIITGTIKANFPTKVAFYTSKESDSRIIIDDSGAESLLGMGDMIFSSFEGDLRLQGFFA